MHAKIAALAALLALSAAGNAAAAAAQDICAGDEKSSATRLVADYSSGISLSRTESWGAMDESYLPYALYCRAQAYVRLEKYALARADLETALKPYHRHDAVFWGALVAVAEKTDDAVHLSALLDEMTGGSPKSAGILNVACWTRAEHGAELDKALAQCDAALALAPADAAIYDSRCLVRYRLGQFAAAAQDCDAALTGDAKMETALYVRGLARLRLGDSDVGKADIAAATALDPKIAETYAGYGVKP
jgi:tetratricopeptide (TPR) repeat protein